MPGVPEPAQVAAAADITIVNQTPAADPYTHAQLDRPAVCARIRVPYRFLLLGWIGLRVVDMTVAASAEIRT
jgi:hypothetical protein